MDIENRINSIKKKANEIKQSQAYQKAAAFMSKVGKKTINKYNSLSKKGKMVLWGGLIAAVTAGGVSLAHKIEEHKKEVKQKEYVQSKIDKLTTKQKITDKESFDKLFNDAFPMIVASMMPTECLVLKPYSDNGICSNTIGVGSYWYPKGSNPNNSTWELSSKHFKNNQDTVITCEHAIDLIEGWAKSREGGHVYKKMRDKLIGAELSPNELAAIFGVMYNNEKNGANLCDFVRKNYNDPMKCAQKIISYKPQKKFEKGIAKRHLHEAYLYLNFDNYAYKIYNFQYFEGVNSLGNHYITTSVTQLSEKDTERGEKAIASGDKQQIIDAQNDIVNYVKKGAKTIGEVFNDNISDPNYLVLVHEYNILAMQGGNIDFYDNQNLTVSPDKQYKEALSHYEKAREFEKSGNKEKAQKEFEEALKGFQKMQKEGVHGADLNNDIAITYYHLGEYKKCIEESKKVIKTGETETFAAAYYNMGLAYRELNNPTEAKKCFDNYKNNGGSEKAYRSALNSLQNKPSGNAYRGR